MKNYQQFLDKLKNDQLAKMKEFRKLFDDGKIDESRFAKIEANVIEIVSTVLKHRISTIENDNDLIESYKKGLNNLLTPWEHQKQVAVDSNDFENEHIESLKIAKVHDIIREFDSFVGVKDE
jgi:hypothetical protein